MPTKSLARHKKQSRDMRADKAHRQHLEELKDMTPEEIAAQSQSASNMAARRALEHARNQREKEKKTAQGRAMQKAMMGTPEGIKQQEQERIQYEERIHRIKNPTSKSKGESKARSAGGDGGGGSLPDWAHEEARREKKHKDDGPKRDLRHLNIEWRPAGEGDAGTIGGAEDGKWVRRAGLSDGEMLRFLKHRAHVYVPLVTLMTLFSSSMQKAARQLRKQRTLWINRGHLGDEDAEILAEWIALGTMCNLKTLSMYGNDFHDRGTDALFEALRRGVQPPTLQTLNLSGSAMSEEGAPALARALLSPSLAQLRMLVLNGNGISDDGLRVVCEALTLGALSQLTDLGLKGTGIGDEGMRHLALACTGGALPKVEKVMLSENFIGDAGLEELNGAFADGALPNLSSLSLAENEIGEDGLSSFLQMAASPSTAGGPTLPRLASLALRSREDIRECPLSRAMLREFVATIEHGAFPSMYDLHLYAEATELREACAARGIKYHVPDIFWDEVKSHKHLRSLGGTTLGREGAGNAGMALGLGVGAGFSAF